MLFFSIFFFGVCLLFSRLELQEMPLDVVLRVFSCYIMPIFEYGLTTWISGKYSAASESSINSLFTKFLKRYLNLPMCTANSIVYHITNTMPLVSLLKQLSHKRTSSIYLPDCMNGTQLSFFNNLPKTVDSLESRLSQIPTYFWRSRPISRLPANQKFRKSLCQEVCDSKHYEYCSKKNFHSTP